MDPDLSSKEQYYLPHIHDYRQTYWPRIFSEASYVWIWMKTWFEVEARIPEIVKMKETKWRCATRITLSGARPVKEVTRTDADDALIKERGDDIRPKRTIRSGEKKNVRNLRNTSEPRRHREGSYQATGKRTQMLSRHRKWPGYFT